jgi:transcriptional regulator with XRE-family HTH domain
MKTFGEILRDIRSNNDLSRVELAERAGLAPDAIASLEQGRRKPTWETVQALCRALGVSSETFRDDQVGEEEKRSRVRSARTRRKRDEKE